MDYIELIGMSLDLSPGFLENLVADAGEKALRRRRVTQKWSAHEHWHFYRIEELLLARDGYID